MIEQPDKCPKCNAEVDGELWIGNLTRYTCGTTAECGDLNGQSDCCRIAELTTENAKLRDELDALTKACSEYSNR